MLAQDLEQTDNSLNTEKKETSKRNFFQINQNTLIALAIIAAMSGAAFAIFYFGVVSIAATVTFLGKFGLSLEALNSMSTLAASGILAGVTAGITSVVAATAYAVSSSFSALSNWFSKPSSQKIADDKGEQETNQEDDSLNITNKSLKDLSAGSEGLTQEQNFDINRQADTTKGSPILTGSVDPLVIDSQDNTEDDDAGLTITAGMGNN